VINTLQEAHSRVWTFRRKYSKWWSTPDALDSLRFAYTEAAEALDAHLRQKGGYARNNEREQDIVSELADCAIMLLTALGPNYEFRPMNVTYSNPSEEYLDWIAGDVGASLAAYKRWEAITRKHGRDANRHIYEEGILLALGFIVNYPGMDLVPMIDARLERIRRKHVKEGHDGQDDED